MVANLQRVIRMHYVVLTDDYYLYLGVKLSLAPCRCEHLHLSGDDILIEPNDELILFVDSRIFFSKIWSNFNRIFSCIPQANLLWLTHRSSCRFLLDDIGFYQEIDRLESHFFQRMVGYYMKHKGKRKLSIGINEFTIIDLKMIHCIIDGMSLKEISLYLNRPIKQIYALRSKLSVKMGLRHASHLSFYLDNISPFIILLNLLIYKGRRMDFGEKKQKIMSPYISSMPQDVTVRDRILASF